MPYLPPFPDSPGADEPAPNCFPGSKDPRCPAVPSGQASYLAPPNCFPGSTDTRCNGFTEGSQAQGSELVPQFHFLLPTELSRDADPPHQRNRRDVGDLEAAPSAFHHAADKQPEQELFYFKKLHWGYAT
ncbi:uncharacterized protein LOC117647408 [Thrips palmi]|uniref:Uncharacterized protein LOC117647408 n=1 Tax=Thrips palmi TaxID=161013 RepID=A0A6P8Z5D5_THRPL|nr:uncharacterized protein LOC117647408 [Thrips palmi]